MNRGAECGLWLLPIWAHLLWTLGCVSLFLDAIYWPLVTRVDGPLDEAHTNLASTLGGIGLLLILLGSFPLMAGAALHLDRLGRFRRPG